MIFQLRSRFPKLSALVVGDICLDRWCHYDPNLAQPSRETGIPRVAVTGTEITPGAGGTVANNLAALCVGRISVLGVTGDDGSGYELRQALEARNIEHNLLLKHPHWTTFTYTKIINEKTHIEDRPRLDFITDGDLPKEAEEELLNNFRRVASEFDVILVSDQAETERGGVVGVALRLELERHAAENPEKIIWVDSRMRAELFRKVIVKVNEDEANAACMRAFGEVDFDQLRDLTEAPVLLVTHGGDGVTLVDCYGELLIETTKVANPVDICGAGDSFSAGAAMAFCVTGSAQAAVKFGNAVAAVTILKPGTGTASWLELLVVENDSVH